MVPNYTYFKWRQTLATFKTEFSVMILVCYTCKCDISGKDDIGSVILNFSDSNVKSKD